MDGLLREPGAAPRHRPDDGRLIRGRRSKERIRAAARELFRERGFDRATLRAIAERAGMGASSIYRHVRSKEELLVEELAALQEEAWRRFRSRDDRRDPVRERVRSFLETQHALLIQAPDLTIIAIRATTYPEARVAARVLALHDRAIGLLAEILQGGRMQGSLHRDLDLLGAARALFHVTQGAWISWANGMTSAEETRSAIGHGVDLLFCGIEAR